MDVNRSGAERFKIFADARVVVTGGLGFIGSTLVRRLLSLGSEVLVLDNRLPGSGANSFNVSDLGERLLVRNCDIRDQNSLFQHLQDRQFLFNLAAQTSHQASMTEPMIDVDINCRAQLGLLEACRAANPMITIVFASTRQIYGKPDYLPVDERHSIRPVDVNGISKAAGEAFHLLYHRVYSMRCVSLRLTNTYGPRMRIADGRQTFIGDWLRAAIQKRPFQVWGGQQLRDFIYVEDAVDGFLMAATCEATVGKAFNIGGHEPVSLRQLAELLVKANGGGNFEITEFPAERKLIDIGNYYSDDTLFRRSTGWAPRTNLSDGLVQTLAFFRDHHRHYV